MGSAPARSEPEGWQIADAALALSVETVGDGPRGLMRAVLVDAIHCLVGGGRGGSVRAREWRHARRWLLARESDWPFSFLNICAELEIDPTLLRRRLLASTVHHSGLLPCGGRIGASRKR